MELTSFPPGGALYRETNHFALIDRPRRLAFRSSLTMPDGSDIERDVEVRFKSEDAARTRMTIVQKEFPNGEVRDAFGAGFLASLTGSSASPRRGPFVANRGPRGAVRYREMLGAQ